MKISLFNTLGAIALTSLAITLTPSTLSAHGSSLDHGDRNKGHRPSGHGSRTCSRLPHGCRETNYRGQRCWFGGGHYYSCAPTGGYVIIDQPEVEVETEVVEQPVVETTYESEDAVTVSVLPDDVETVYIGGERCWFHDGCYYRRSGHGYCKWHGKDRGHGKVCKNDRGHGDRGKGRTCSTKSHNTSGHHSTSHTSGHSSGHSHK
jgi:hypothetical protein